VLTGQRPAQILAQPYRCGFRDLNVVRCSVRGRAEALRCHTRAGGFRQQARGPAARRGSAQPPRQERARCAHFSPLEASPEAPQRTLRPCGAPAQSAVLALSPGRFLISGPASGPEKNRDLWSHKTHRQLCGPLLPKDRQPLPCKGHLPWPASPLPPMLGARFFAPCCARGLVLRSVAPGARTLGVPAGTSPSGMHGPIPVLSIVKHALVRAHPHVFGQAALGVAPVAHPTAMAALRALSGSVASRSAPGPHLKTVDAPRHVTHRAALARSMVLPQAPPGRAGARGVASAVAPSAGAGDGAGEQERVFDTEEGPQDRAMGIWLLGVSGMVRAPPRSAPLCAPTGTRASSPCPARRASLSGRATQVAGMVVLGGLTRLTGSGLSMTKWRPHSEMPPMTQAPPPPRTKWTRRVPHPVLIGHAASLTPYSEMPPMTQARAPRATRTPLSRS